MGIIKCIHVSIISSKSTSAVSIRDIGQDNLPVMTDGIEEKLWRIEK